MEIYIIEKELLEQAINAVGKLPANENASLYLKLKNIKPNQVEQVQRKEVKQENK